MTLTFYVLADISTKLLAAAPSDTMPVEERTAMEEVQTLSTAVSPDTSPVDEYTVTEEVQKVPAAAERAAADRFED
ncbi:uncharacterized protein ATNIH1004_002599 [Aspergillus tanneri]|uniref:Uncharacterized protein n=2 Tax=Aspergillus tanneri TaxID=1220188 RepID=A0A5M9MX49_9EURO|nr:uncharacterized protein ATNIH1004_002599 [Aspergillus tanneri]KAA8649920.1 hypothetical protein ATNIH1004_002599 [Aspergillus tanneri]